MPITLLAYQSIGGRIVHQGSSNNVEPAIGMVQSLPKCVCHQVDWLHQLDWQTWMQLADDERSLLKVKVECMCT